MAKKSKTKMPTQVQQIEFSIGDRVSSNLHSNFRPTKKTNSLLLCPSMYKDGTVVEINGDHITVLFPDKVQHTMPKEFWSKR